MQNTKWFGSTTCDICHEKITDTLYDAKTHYGCWATMCHECHSLYGVGRLGVGFGQKYQNQNGVFIKVEG